MKTNLQLLQENMEKAKKERFLIYDIESQPNKKIIIECDENKANIVSIKGNKVIDCDCKEEKPCKHMIKLAIKENLNVELEKKVTTRKSRIGTKSKVIAIGEK